MGKRFVATERWNKVWFRSLPCRLKCFWSFICDNCDAAGVWEPDFEHASFLIGETVTVADLAAFGNRIGVMKNGRWAVAKFVEFQYGQLSKHCPAHKPIFRLLDKHAKSSDTLCDRVPGRVAPTLQEKEKEKEKDKEKEGGSKGEEASVAGEPVGAANYAAEIGYLLEALGSVLYQRPMGSFGSFEEQRAAYEVIKRPDWRNEREIILSFGRAVTVQDRRFTVPQTLVKLVEHWSETLDKARNYKPYEKPAKHNPRNDGIAIGPTDYGEAARRKLERQALALKNELASEAKGAGA